MLLPDEQHVIRWLGQYDALTKTQLIRMLRKPESTAEKIIQNLRRNRRLTSILGGAYLGLDELCKPDERMILAIWVMLRFIDKIDPNEHYRSNPPAQLFFLKENQGYEIIVLYEGEENKTRLLDDSDEIKYIIVVPNEDMIDRIWQPDAEVMYAVADFNGAEEPEITFYT